MKRVEFEVDGETVRGRLHTPPGVQPRLLPLVVMGHGLASSDVEFYDFPEKIAEGGYAALALSHRGHGDSQGERGYLSKERALADFKGAIQAMAKEYGIDAGRVALLGHSTGGALVLCAASHLPEVRCVVALAPIARMRDEMNPFEFLLYNVARVINLPIHLFSKRGMSVPYKIDYHRLYASRESVQRAQKDDFLQHWLPVKDYGPLVRDLNGIACAENLHLPTLVMAAQYDVVVGKYNTRRVFDALPGPKKLVEVPRSGHSMCGDARSDFVAAHVREFLDLYLKGAPAA